MRKDAAGRRFEFAKHSRRANGKAGRRSHNKRVRQAHKAELRKDN